MGSSPTFLYNYHLTHTVLMYTPLLLVYIALSVGFLFVLVLWLRLHAFIALLLTSIFLGLLCGVDYIDIAAAIQDGMGGTLGFVATVVGIGAIFGQVLESSGGTEAIARSLIRRFGEKYAPWSLSIAGFLVAIPVFFDVGFILLVPIIYVLSRETNRSVLLYAIPLLAGLAVTHAFIPPTPGPVAVADILGADLGLVALVGFVVAIPTVAVAGPIFGQWIAKRIHPQLPPAPDAPDPTTPAADLPSFGLVTGIILIPLLLMMSGSIYAMLQKSGVVDDTHLGAILSFFGHPFVALLFSTLVALYVLGRRRGLSKELLQKLSDKSLAPAGMIVLVTGAGGVFKQMLTITGVGDSLAYALSESGLPVLLLAFVIAVLVRVSLGSLTVSMITAAGIVAPILDRMDISDMQRALVVIAIASGGTMLSHVNDSGFWLVGKYLGMNEKETLKSWTVMESIIGLMGFAMTSLLWCWV